MKGNTKSTLTYKVAAIEVKMLHLQYRMKKIYDDQAILNDKKDLFKTNREKIRGLRNTAYTVIDMLSTMEHMYQLVSDFFAVEELRQYFNKRIYQLLNDVKKISEKWKYVRNKVGGHIDFEVVEEMCRTHHFTGVLLSDDLETDVSVYNLLLIESAINASRKSKDIFGRDLVMKENLQAETKVIVDRLNADWKTVFDYFEPLMQFLYKHGKKEKIAATMPGQQRGLIIGE